MLVEMLEVLGQIPLWTGKLCGKDDFTFCVASESFAYMYDTDYTPENDTALCSSVGVYVEFNTTTGHPMRAAPKKTSMYW